MEAVPATTHHRAGLAHIAQLLGQFMKRALLQTLGKQTKDPAIPIEQLEKIAAFAPEDEKRARERVLLQDFRRKHA